MKNSVLLLLATVLLAGTVRGDDWTKWRGPHANGVSEEQRWNAKALQVENILWKTELGFGHSAVAVQGNAVYTMGNRRISGIETDVVYCLDAGTGEIRWQHSYACSDGGEDPGPGSTPVIDGDWLYTLSREGHLLCLNAATGQLRWSRHLVNDSLARKHNWGFSSSPVISGNRLLLNINQNGMALDKNTGLLLWNSRKMDCGYATPVLLESRGRTLALIQTKRKLRAMDIKDGNVVWTQSVGWGDADPVVLDHSLLFAGQTLRLFDITPTAPKPIWQNKTLAWQFQSGTVIEGHYYGFGVCDWDNRKQEFNCVDLSDGTLKWQQTFEMWGASTAAGDKLIIQTGDGETIIAEASPEGFTPIRRARLIAMADNSQRQSRRRCFCWTHPVLAHGRLYLRNSDGNLVCIAMHR